MKEEKKIESPVYLSVKRLEKVLSIISARSMTSLDPDYFLTYSFSSSDANLAIASLRFLGLIDSNSDSTPLMAKMGYKGNAKVEAFVEMVKTGYGKLFGEVPEANKINKDELHNDFMHIYKISSRVASSAVPAFIYLCEQAGLRKDQLESKVKKISNPSIKKNDSREGGLSKKTGFQIATETEHTIIPFSKSGIKLVLPVDVLTDINLFEEYKKLISSITAFSDEYLKSKNQNKDDETIPTKEQ